MTDEEIVNKACRVCSSPVSALNEAIRLARADERERCVNEIRKNCGPCGGRGFMSVDSQGNPVECEYCGRPMNAIRAGKGDDQQKGGER